MPLLLGKTFRSLDFCCGVGIFLGLQQTFMLFGQTRKMFARMRGGEAGECECRSQKEDEDDHEEQLLFQHDVTSRGFVMDESILYPEDIS